MKSKPSLTEVFLARLDPPLRAQLASWSELETCLAGFCQAARSAWPGVVVAPEVLLSHLAEKLTLHASPQAGLERIPPGDLYLACACAHGQARAIAAFETHFLPLVAAALKRMRVPASVLEEAKQLLRCRLFVGREGRQGEIADYAGLGDLRSWVRAVAVHTALTLLRKQRREAAQLGQEAAWELASPIEDAELGYLKRRYGAAFKVAFEEAMRSLSARERNLLRHHFVDGLGIDQIGLLYGIHRATAARRLVKLQKSLLGRTRRSLRQRLGVAGAELESVLRLVSSQAPVSIVRFLRSAGPLSSVQKKRDRGAGLAPSS